MSKPKPAKKLHELQEEYKESVVGLCCVCEKPVSMWYGRWGDVGTCNRVCERAQAAKPKYPDHTEEQFLKKFGLENEP